jgi:asparagine N-glycosylation enzyme membrane subunit Stt3
VRKWVAHRYKVFGVVPGAEVIIHSVPGRTVNIKIPLRTNQGRKFHWRASGVADEEGQVTFSLPYSTGANGAVVAIGPYRLTDGKHEQTLTLTDAQVQKGDRVVVKHR